jgi:hypothetical protein
MCMQTESMHTHIANETGSGKTNEIFNFNIAVNNKFDVLHDFNTTKAHDLKINSPSTKVKFKNKTFNNHRVENKNSRKRSLKNPILNKTLENILTFVDKKYKESLNDFRDKQGAEDINTKKYKANRIRRTELNKTRINKLTQDEIKLQISIYKEKKSQYVNRMAILRMRRKNSSN